MFAVVTTWLIKQKKQFGMFRAAADCYFCIPLCTVIYEPDLILNLGEATLLLIRNNSLLRNKTLESKNAKKVLQDIL